MTTSPSFILLSLTVLYSLILFPLHKMKLTFSIIEGSFSIILFTIALNLSLMSQETLQLSDCPLDLI